MSHSTSALATPFGYSTSNVDDQATGFIGLDYLNKQKTSNNNRLATGTLIHDQWKGNLSFRTI
ncbi:hypothetical protein H9L39_09475 [Fusarium oxysporum f. sp. albedinis]|nr:hypothetical protein H9L39_09475 [Fusarium oxysporum f. sp. albedinis]